MLTRLLAAADESDVVTVSDSRGCGSGADIVRQLVKEAPRSLLVATGPTPR